ncbi:MAG: glycosyl hydrolase family 8 [Clostridiales bacterium]|nr:glycosyl hydrolase family 8 [Clostridiales bacterium]
MRNAIKKTLVVALALCLCVSLTPAIAGAGTDWTPQAAIPIYAQEDMNEAVLDAYEAWKDNFIAEYYSDENPKEPMYFLNWGGGDEDWPVVTVSEAHGYAMLITAQMAEYDEEAQGIFNGLVDFMNEFPSIYDDGLMAWAVMYDGEDWDAFDEKSELEQGCLYVDDEDGDSATDGDMDMAYALLLADKTWGSTKDYDYKGMALSVINGLADTCIHPDYGFLQLGDWAQTHDEEVYVLGTRPSDFMFDHMKAFYAATKDKRWLDCIGMCYQCLSDVQKLGLVPDFCIYDPDAKKFGPAPLGVSEDEETGGLAYLESEYDQDYNWNSCRVPWRLATDVLLTGGDEDGKVALMLKSLNDFIKGASASRPAYIQDGYRVYGGKAGTPIGKSGDRGDGSFTSPFMLAAVATGDKDWAKALWDYAVDKVDWEDYFPANISLLCMITASGIYQPLAGDNANSLFEAFIEGFEDNTFRGGALMTREQFVAILQRINGALDYEPDKAAPSFSDVPSSKWSFGAIEWALDEGIIEAGDGSFRPMEPLTRAEMAVMLVRAEDLTETAENNFSDLEGDPDCDDILKAVNVGMFTGYPDGTFRPSGSTTRSEAVTALIRYLLGGEPSADMWQGIDLKFTDVKQSNWAYKYIALAVTGY